MADIIRDMGPYLTSDTTNVRVWASQLIARLLSSSVVGALPESDARAMLTFLCERMRDYPSVGACLDGLCSLVVHHGAALPDDAGVTVWRTIFQELHVPAMEQPRRQQVFEVLSVLLEQDAVIDASRGYWPEFAGGVVQILEGEKDPRCLLAALRMVRRFLEVADHASLAPYMDDLFDVTGCYFPITFTPPPNDPYGIRPEWLVRALRSVLIACRGFAPHLLPLILEKLSSSVLSAKYDAATTLAAAVQSYGVPPLEPHLPAVADALREEIARASGPLSGESGPGDGNETEQDPREDARQAISEADVVAAALRTVRILAHAIALHVDQVGEREPWTKFTAPLVRRAVADVQESPDSLRGRAAVRLLQALASAAPSVSRFVWTELAPTLASFFSALDLSVDTGDTFLPVIRDCDEIASVLDRSHLAALMRVSAALFQAISPSLDAPPGQHPVQPLLPTYLPLLEAVISAELPRIDPKGSDPRHSKRAVTRAAETQATAAMALADLLCRPPSPLLDPDQHRRAMQSLVRFYLAVSDETATAVGRALLLRVFRGKPHTQEAGIKWALPELLDAVSAGAVEGDEAGSEAERASEALARLGPLHPHLFAVIVSRLAALEPSSPRAVWAILEKVLDVVVTQPEFTPYLNALVSGEFPDGSECVALVPQRLAVLAAEPPPLEDVEAAFVARPAEETASSTAASLRAVLRVLEGCDPDTRVAVRYRLLSWLIGNDDGHASMDDDNHSSPPSQLRRGLADVPRGPLSVNGDTFAPLCTADPTPIHTSNAMQSLCVVALNLVLAGPAAPPVAAEVQVAAGRALMGHLLDRHLDGPVVHRLLARAVAAWANRSPPNAVAEWARLADERLLRPQIMTVPANKEGWSQWGRALRGVIAVTKGLAMRNAKEAKQLVGPLCDMLRTETDASATSLLAQSLAMVLREEAQGPLSARGGAIIKGLYEQRFFSYVRQSLLPSDGAANPADVPVGVVEAICRMTAELPPTVLETVLESVIPLLLHAMRSVSSWSVRDAAVRVLADVVQRAPSHLERHIMSLVPALLDIARSGPRPATRWTAVAVLEGLLVFPFHQLYPMRDDVIRGLLPVLDDSRRAIRQRASRCRNQWCVPSWAVPYVNPDTGAIRPSLRSRWWWFRVTGDRITASES